MANRRLTVDVAVALTAALLAIPVIVLLTPVPPRTLPAFAVAAAVTFVAVLPAARFVEDLPALLDGPGAAVVLAGPVLSVGWLLTAFGGPESFLAAAVVGTLALLPAGAGVAVAHALVLDERMAASEVLVAFEARRANRLRYAAFLVVVVGAGVLVVAVGISAFLGGSGPDAFEFLPAAAGAVGGALVVGGEREVTVTDRGVRVDNTFHEWDDLASYDITDDALVLRRPVVRWSPRFDRSDVDVDAVEAVLSRYLPAAN